MALYRYFIYVLLQRKNNLCRRIRIEKQKNKEKAAGEKKGGAAACNDATPIMEIEHRGSPAHPPPQPQAVPPENVSQPGTAVSATESTDPFMEDILDLPGIDEFDIDYDGLDFDLEEEDDDEEDGGHVDGFGLAPSTDRSSRYP